MFTVGLALAESFGSGTFSGLYGLTFIIDIALFQTLEKIFSKGK